MKRTTSIVLFASIFAVAVGTLGLSGNSATSLMVAADPQSQDSMGMLGHVEYKLVDNSGNIKAYMQNDNIVVQGGEDCAAEYLFGDITLNTCSVNGTPTPFTHVAIGNHTSTINVANFTLSDASNTGASDKDVDCAGIGGNDGEMARLNPGVTNTYTPSSGGGAVVEMDTSSNPFVFDANNATTVYDSGLFNSGYGDSLTACDHADGTFVAGSDTDMFATQNLNGATGITVSDGDSLSVKWTITVG